MAEKQEETKPAETQEEEVIDPAIEEALKQKPDDSDEEVKVNNTDEESKAVLIH
jgi:hypothetical protein